MSFFRPEIESTAGYVPGEQPQDGEFIKLNTNENPYPPSPQVVRAIEETLGRLRKYPDPLAGEFRRRAGELLGVPPDWILCGNGSDDILTIVTRTFVGQGQLLRLPYPSYILYKTLADLQARGAKRCGSTPIGRCRPRSLRRRRFARRVLSQPQQPLGHDGSARARARYRRTVAVPLIGR